MNMFYLYLWVCINQRGVHIYICTATGLLRQEHAAKKQQLLLSNSLMLILYMGCCICAAVETALT